jgi:hypothetical protein
MVWAEDIVVSLPTLPIEIIDPQNLPARHKLGRPPGSKTIIKDALPICTRCQGNEVKRAGLDARGKQRYRCRPCNRSFGGPCVQVVDSGKSYNLICYRCGAEHCKGLGQSAASGRLGFCSRCRQRFIQGGRNDLARYHLLLEHRIAERKLPDDVAAELLQISYMDVITGAGYCWTVPLREKDAWKVARGEWGQKGSDHPKFRQQMGQSKYDQ